MRRRRKRSATNGPERRDGQQAVMARCVAEPARRPQGAQCQGRRHQGRDHEIRHRVFSSVRAQRQTRSWPQLLEEYKAAVARSEATKVSLEDQAQMAASAETETQQAQHTVSQVESEAVKDAANVEQAVKAQEDAKAGEAAVSSKAASAREAASDAERDLDDARSSEASQQTEYEYNCSPEREYPVWIGESSSSSSTTFRQCGPRRERGRLTNRVRARSRECSAGESHECTESRRSTFRMIEGERYSRAEAEHKSKARQNSSPFTGRAKMIRHNQSP